MAATSYKPPKSRMTKAKMSSYMRNVGRSFGYAIPETLKSMNPTITALFKSTAEQSKELYQSIKNFDAKSLGFETDDLKGTLSQGLKDLRDNALDDIRTGKWYNKERIEAVNNQIASDAFGINFDDFGDFDDFNFDDTDLDEQASITEDVTEATVTAMDVVGGKVSSAISTAAVKSADYIVESGRLNTKALYNLNLSGFGQVNKGVAAINGNLQLLVGMAEPLSQHMQNSALFYTKSQEYYNESLSMLKQIAANTAPKSSNSYGTGGTKRKGYMDYINSEGIIDFQSMIMDGAKRVKENTELITSMLSMVPGGEKAIIKMYTASPIQFALTAVIGQMFNIKDKRGRSIRKSFEEFNSVLSNISAGLLGKAKRSEFGDIPLLSPLLRTLRDYILPSNSIIKKPDVSKYEKGKVDWDGMSRKALMDVIPTQLSQILTALTGEPERRFDYNTGKWVKLSTVRINRDRDLRKITNNAGGDLFKYVNKSIDNSNMHRADKRAYKDQIENFLEKVVLSGDDAFLEILSEDFNFEKYGMSNAMGKNLQKRIRAIQKQKGGNLALSSFVGNVYNARNAYSRRNENLFGAEAALYDKSTTGGRQNYSGKLIDMKDEFGFSQGDYLRHILEHVTYISKNLKNLGGGNGGRRSRKGQQTTVWEPMDLITRSNNKVTNLKGSVDRDNSEIDYDDRGVESSVGRAMNTSVSGPGYSDAEKKVLAKYGNDPDAIPVSEPLRDKIIMKRDAYDISGLGKGILSGGYDRLKSGKLGGFINKAERDLGLSTERVSKALDEMSIGLTDFIYDKDKGLYSLMNTMTLGALDVLKGLIPQSVRDLFGAAWGKFRSSDFGQKTFTSLKNIGLSFFGKHIISDKANREINRTHSEFGQSVPFSGNEITPNNYNPNYSDISDIAESGAFEFEPVDYSELDEEGSNGSGLVNRYFRKLKRNQFSGGSFWGRYNRGSYRTKANAAGYSRIRKAPRSRARRSAGFSGAATTQNAEEAASPDDDDDVISNGGALKEVLITAGKSLAGKIFNKMSDLYGDLFDKSEDDKKHIGDTINKLMQEAGLNKGAIGAGAFIGAGASIISGALVGPIAGAAIGAAVGFVSKSETAQNYLFGKWEDGEQKEKGVLPESISKFFKQNAESTAKGAGVGLVAGSFMGSPILGAIVGATAGYVSSSETARKALFGEKDSQGNLNGGIYSETINIIKQNLNDAISPISTEIKNKTKDVLNLLIGGITRAAKSVFESAVASPLMSKINDKILQPLTRTLTKGIGGLVAAPFKAIGSVGRGLRRKQISTGRANNMSAAERLRYRRVNGMSADEFVDFDTVLQDMTTEEIDELLESYKNSDNKADVLSKISAKFGLQNINLNENNAYKYLDTIKAESKNRSRTPEALAKETQAQRDKLIENHYLNIEDMLANIANKILKDDVFPTRTKIRNVTNTNTETTENTTETTSNSTITSALDKEDTRQNFKSVVRSAFNPFHGMDMQSVEDAIGYYEEVTNGTRISAKYIGREIELSNRVKKKEINGVLRDDIITVEDKYGVTRTVQNVNGSWVLWQWGKNFVKALGETKIGSTLKGIGHAIKGGIRAIYNVIIDDPFSLLNQEDVNRVQWTYYQINFPDEARGSLPSDDDMAFYNDHCRIIDEKDRIIRITDSEGKQAIGKFDERTGRWKKVSLISKAKLAVKSFVKSVKTGFNTAKLAVTAIGRELKRHINPFYDFKDPKELEEIIDSLNNMEFNNGHDETGKIHQIEGLDHYYTIITKDASTTVTNQNGRWVYVSNKALELAKTKRLVSGIGGAIAGGIKNVFHKITGKRRAEKINSNETANKFFQNNEENETAMDTFRDMMDELGQASGSGLVKRLGISGRGFLDNPFEEQDELASNKGRQKIKEKQTFLGGIAAIPSMSYNIDKIADTLDKIKGNLVGAEKEKKPGLFDKLKEMILGENGLLGGFFKFFTGKTGGGYISNLLTNFNFKRDVIPLLIAGLASKVFLDALAGKFDKMFQKYGFGRDRKNLGVNSNAAYTGATAKTEDGRTVAIATDENGDYILDEDGNYLSTSGEVLKNLSFESTESTATDPFNTRLNKSIVRGTLTGTPTALTGLGKLGKWALNKSIITKAPANYLARKGGALVNKGLGKGMQQIANAATGRTGQGALTSLTLKMSGQIDDVFKALSKVPVLRKLPLDNLAQGLKDMVFKDVQKGAGKEASKLAKNILGTAAFALKVVMAAVDFEEGYNDAYVTFHVNDPTLTEKIISGIIRVLKNLIPFVGLLIPDSKIIDLIVDKLGFDPGDLKKRREEADEELAAYNEENGTDLSFEEYQKQVLGHYTWGERLGNSVKSLGGKVKGGITKISNGITNLNEQIKEKGIVGVIGSSASAAANKITEGGAKAIKFLKEQVFDVNWDALEKKDLKDLFKVDELSDDIPLAGPVKLAVIATRLFMLPKMILVKAFDTVKKKLFSFVDGVKKTIDEIKEKGVVGYIKEKAAAAWGNVKNKATELWNELSGGKSPNEVDAETSETSGGYSGVVSQLDPRYAKYRVGGRSFASNGCGPASAVMAAGGKLGDAVRVAQKYQTSGGTDAAYFGEMFGRRGMKANYYVASGSLIGDIASGKPTVLMGQDIYNTSKDYSPFGPNNHYVVANGFDRSGNILISDPEQGGVRSYSPGILNNVKLGVSGGASHVNGTYIPVNQTLETTTQAGLNSTASTSKGRTFTVPGGPRLYTDENGVTTNLTGGNNSATSSGGVDEGGPMSQIWGYLRSKGLNEYARAGLMGCWKAESQLKSDMLEGNSSGKHDSNSIMADNASMNQYTEDLFKRYANQGLKINKSGYYGTDGNLYPGYGLAQWTGPRQQSLIAYTKEHGLDHRSLGGQLDYFWKEYRDRPKLQSAIESAKSLEDGTIAALDNYEMQKPGYHNSSETGRSYYATRLKYANEIYSKMTGLPGSMPGGSVGEGDIGDLTDTEAASQEAKGEKKVSLGGILSTILNAFTQGFSKLFNGSSEDDTSEEGSTTGDSTDSIGGVTNYSGTDPVSYMESIKNKINYTFGSNDIEHGKGDCSGTVGWAVAKSTGLDIGRSTEAMYNNTKNLKPIWYNNGQTAGTIPAEAKRNDILLFSRPTKEYTVGRPDRVGHVGLYMGDNKYIHIGSGKGPVEKSFESSSNLIKVSRLVDENGNEINFENQEGLEDTNVSTPVGERAIPRNYKANLIEDDPNANIGAMGSGLINYKASRAGNYILHDTSRNYYKKEGAGYSAISNTPSVSGGNLLSAGRSVINNVSAAARHKNKQASELLPMNVASISKDTKEMNANLEAIAQAMKTIMEKIDNKNVAGGANANTPSNYGGEDMSALEDLRTLTLSATSI